MADAFGVTPYGVLPYGAEYLQAASRYGVPGGVAPTAGRHNHPQTAPHVNRPKAPARARDPSAPSQQQPAAARQDEEHDIGDGLEEKRFALVSTAELEQQGLKKHPDKIAEAASLNSVTLPAGKYKLGLPAFVIQGRISALQFQSVRLACQRHETFLPDKTRAGFFLGDGEPCLSAAVLPGHMKQKLRTSLLGDIRLLPAADGTMGMSDAVSSCVPEDLRMLPAADGKMGAPKAVSSCAGPGVGKGRQIASLIFENILRGRKKAVWFSASGDLAQDAKRDFHDIGALPYETVRMHDLKHSKIKASGKLADGKDFDFGVLFSTYDLLISGRKVSVGPSRVAKQVGELAEEAGCEGEVTGPDKMTESSAGLQEFGDGSRLSQIVEWLGGEAFDGAIVFDECHKAKNCIAKQGDAGRRQAESKTSRAVVEFQRRLPNARVLYVSATGATEADNLCYMTRLGLWGEQTAFPNKQEFVNMLNSQGVAAMELVAMELKQAGSFIARTLSYEGVEFENQYIKITDEYKDMYDKAAAVWLQVKEAVDECRDKGLTSKELSKTILGQFFGGQLRFFRQLCTAAKVDTIADMALKTLQEGKCVVIGLQSTGEARTEAMVQAANKTGDADAFDSFAEPAGLILTTVMKMLPAQYAAIPDLLRQAQALKLPGNPLDELIERLGGVDRVAEMSGRKKRMVKQPDGSYKYLSRSGNGIPLDGVNIAEKDAFQDGRKLVAVISDAASTGISLHADRSRKNTRQRVHVTLELAWSADRTVQQLGRSHRSNQLQPPRYVIVSTDICGEHRFASAVAARLQQLGALTHGDRRAASAADILQSSNLQNKYSQSALRKMYRVLLGNELPPEDVTPPFIEDEMSGIGSLLQQSHERQMLFNQFIPDGKDALLEVGVLKEDAKTELDKQMAKQQQAPGGNVNKLLNRLLGCQVDMQSKIFGYFSALQEAEIKQAKDKGTYDQYGIIKPRGEKITFKRKDVVYQDDYSGMCTYHAEFEIDRGMNWDAALKCIEEERAEDPETQAGFYETFNGNRTHHVLALPRDAQGRKLQTTRQTGRRGKNKASYWRLVRPASGFSDKDMSYDEFEDKYKKMRESSSFKAAWNEEWKAAKGKPHRTQPLHLLTGSILPILPTVDKYLRGKRMDNGRMWHMQVMRVESTDEQHQEVGLYLHNSHSSTTLMRIRQLQPLKPWQFAGGADSVDLTGSGSTAANPFAARQSLLGPGPRETGTLDPTLVDLSLDDDDADADKENSRQPKVSKPRAPRDKAEKRVHRKKTDGVAAEESEATEEDVVEPDAMLAAGLWEDIELPARRQVVEPPPAKARPPKQSQKAELAMDSDAETEQVQEGKEDDSSSEEDSGSKDNSSRRPRSGSAKDSRPSRVSKDKAAEALAKMSVNDNDDAADMEVDPGSAADKAKHMHNLSSRLLAARASRASGPNSAAASDAHSDDSGTTGSEAAKGKAAGLDALDEADEEAESPAPVMLKSRKGKSSIAGVGKSRSRQPSVTSNSEVSDGWVVRCKCGADDDDGEAMTECEGGCKTWVHDSCHGLGPGALFWCDACKENVQTSKASEPASLDGADSKVAQPTLLTSNNGGAAQPSLAKATSAATATSGSSADDMADDSSPAAATSRAASGVADDEPNGAGEGARPRPDSAAEAGQAVTDIDMTAASPRKTSAQVLPSSARKAQQMQLTVKAGRVEKTIGTSLKQALAKGHSSKAPAAEVIDLDNSSREGSPEAASRADSPPALPASDLETRTSSMASAEQLTRLSQAAAGAGPNANEKAGPPFGSPAKAACRNPMSDSAAGIAKLSAAQASPQRPPLQPLRSLVSNLDAVGTDIAGAEASGSPSKATPSKRARGAASTRSGNDENASEPSGTPSKATPSKRGRNAGASRGSRENIDEEDGCVLVGELTPGKRRKSLLSLPNRPTLDARAQQQDAEEVARLRRRCAALEAAAARQLVEAQPSSAGNRTAYEAEVRRSVQAEFDKKMSEAKVNLMKRALDVGKKKGRADAEAELKEQMQALQSQAANVSKELQASNTAFAQERSTWQEQLQAWQRQQADHAAAVKQHQVDRTVSKVQQRQHEHQLAAQHAQREAQAELEFERKQAEEHASWQQQQEQTATQHAQRQAQAELELKHQQEAECQRWKLQQQQWDAERAAQAQHAQQLQKEMAAMKADLEQYKAALAAAKQEVGPAHTIMRVGSGTPTFPHTPGNPLMAFAPSTGQNVTDAAAAFTPDPGQGRAIKGGADTISKRVSWAPLPASQSHSNDSTAEVEAIQSSSISKTAVLAVLQSGAATLSDICSCLKAKQQHAVSSIVQELQDDFEVATKNGQYFLV